MIKFIIIIAYSLFVAVATVANPSFLAINKFVDDLATYELLNILGLILTITLASIVHIHFEISRIVARIYSKKLEIGQAKATEARLELNSSAWYLVGSFGSAVILLTIKSEMLENLYWRSGLNGLAIGTLFLMVMIMYDIHRSIFRLAASDAAVLSNTPPSPGKKRGEG